MAKPTYRSRMATRNPSLGLLISEYTEMMIDPFTAVLA